MYSKVIVILIAIICGHDSVDSQAIDVEVVVGNAGSNGTQSDDHRNCTPPAITNFPYISPNLRKSVFMSVLASFVIIYLFIGTALICDEYFVPSLQLICDHLKLESDIAGSTLMAAGSSAPELSASLLGVFVAKDDIGVGTVVGSAVFNIAFVISICALFAGHVVVINWWPILRDSFFYLISICVLFIAMFDGKISLIESIVFLAIYVIYILFMAYNKQIYNKFYHKFHGLVNISRESSDSVIYKTLSEAETSDEVDISNASIDIGANVDYNTNSIDQQLHITSDKCRQTDTSLEDSQSKAKLVWNLLIRPLNLIHWITVPNCRDESKRNCFGFTFFMSCVWISIYSYFIVWMITLIGFNLHIPDTVMGLVFIAFGASIPDAIASLLVVRQGLGDMAVTNAIASNVFDILVCLGVPWFIKTAIVDPGSNVTVLSRGLEYSTISLLTTVVFFLVITHLNGWKLTPKYGLILMVWYLAFISMASLYELNVFGYLNPPVCFNDY